MAKMDGISRRTVLRSAAGAVLAAPLVLDLARLALLAQRRGEVGVLRHLACFFKSPMGVDEHDFFKQWARLEQYVSQAKGGLPA